MFRVFEKGNINNHKSRCVHSFINPLVDCNCPNDIKFTKSSAVIDGAVGCDRHEAEEIRNRCPNALFALMIVLFKNKSRSHIPMVHILSSRMPVTCIAIVSTCGVVWCNLKLKLGFEVSSKEMLCPYKRALG